MKKSSPRAPKLLDRIRTTCRRLHYSLHTERAYCRWTERFVRFHGTVHPRHLDATHVRMFLNHLARERQVAASTQNQALSRIAVSLRQGAPRRPRADQGH